MSHYHFTCDGLDFYTLSTYISAAHDIQPLLFSCSLFLCINLCAPHYLLNVLSSHPSPLFLLLVGWCKQTRSHVLLSISMYFFPRRPMLIVVLTLMSSLLFTYFPDCTNCRYIFVRPVHLEHIPLLCLRLWMCYHILLGLPSFFLLSFLLILDNDWCTRLTYPWTSKSLRFVWTIPLFPPLTYFFKTLFPRIPCLTSPVSY